MFSYSSSSQWSKVYGCIVKAVFCIIEKYSFKDVGVKENLIAYFIYIHNCWHEGINSFISKWILLLKLCFETCIEFKSLFHLMFATKTTWHRSFWSQSPFCHFFMFCICFVFLYVIFTMVEEKQATHYLPTHLPI